MALGGRSRPHQNAKRYMDVVKNEGDISLGYRGQLFTGLLFRSCSFPGSLTSRLFHRKMRDDLRFAVVEEVEVFLMKISHGVALRVAHDDAYCHQLDVHLERRRLLVRSNLRCGLIGMRLGVRRRLRLRGLRSVRLRPRGDGEKREQQRDETERRAKRGEESFRPAEGMVPSRPARPRDARHGTTENHAQKATHTSQNLAPTGRSAGRAAE